MHTAGSGLGVGVTLLYEEISGGCFSASLAPLLFPEHMGNVRRLTSYENCHKVLSCMQVACMSPIVAIKT